MTTMTLKPGTVYQLPPGDLLLERNIRDAKPDDALVASVGSLGVIQPVVAVINADGRPTVRYGFRRTMAAAQAGTATIPVYIAGADDLDAHAEAARVIAQRDENTHRAGLTAAEEIGAVEQLVAFGMSIDEISEQARIAKEKVETVLTVSKSKLAKKSTERYADLTLEHAQAVAEFEDDTEVAKHLIATALEAPAQFDHTLQRHRDDRARAIKRAAVEAEIEAAGAKVVARPNYYDKTGVELHKLLDKRGGKLLTEHQNCPGHVGWISYNGEAEYSCADPKKYGHHDTTSTTKPTKADMTPAEQEKAKAARRLVLDNNKAWGSAEKVRRNWLANFAKGTKTAPKGAAAFIAIGLTKDRHQLAQYDSTPGELVAHWLGAKKPSGGWDLTPHVEKATEARSLVLALVQVLANYESHLTKDSWRGDGRTNSCGRYLRYLQSVGYELSDVEKYAIGKETC